MTSSYHPASLTHAAITAAWRRCLWVLGLISLCVNSGCGPRLESTGMSLYDEMPVIREIFGVGFSPEGDRVLAGGNSGPVNPVDRAVDVWRFPAGTATRPFAGAVNCLAVGIDNQVVVGGHRRLELWDYRTARLLRSFQGHESWVTSVAIRSDGRFILAGTHFKLSDDNNFKMPGECLIRLWDAHSGLELQRFEGHRGPIGAIAFLPNQQQILSVSGDNTIRLWDIESGEELWRGEKMRKPSSKTERNCGYFVGEVPEKYRESLSVTRDGRFVLRGLKIWDLEQLTIHKTFGDAHIAPANCSVFSPDERRILSAHADGKIRLWERATGVEIGSAMVFRNKTVVNSVAFSPDGRFAASGGSGYMPYFSAVANDLPTIDQYVRIWSMPD